MKARDGQTKPLWTKSIDRPKFPAPPRRTACDVCVIGAGISGVTTAYLLAGEGKSVIVVDEGELGAGQTERTSAHLASIIDDRFYEIEHHLGLDASKTAHASHAAGIDLIEKIVKDEAIDCGFERLDAYLFLGEGDTPDTLDRELAAAQRAGVDDAAMVEQLRVGDRALGRAIRFGNQAIFHPMRYLVALAKAAEQRGVKFFSRQRAMDVQGADPSKDQKCVTTLANQSKIDSDHVVVATNTPSPINDWMGIYLKQASYRTYVVELALQSDAVPNALYWDTLDAYHYVRLYRDGEKTSLLAGGEDHKVGQGEPTQERFDALVQWAKQTFPGTGKVLSRWSGQVQEPADGIGFIGRVKHTKGDNVYTITGDSGMGLTHASLGAILVSDLIAGRSNPWESLYDPARKQTNLEFVQEATNCVLQYKDLITGGEVAEFNEVPKGSGRLVRRGLSKLAVYRDDKGAVHKMSAVCTHLGCIVHWNDVEKSWDCPCHGSRFSPKGRVVMGPAIDDLKKID